MSALQNATIRLIRPVALAATGEPLQRDHAEAAVWEGRASLRKVSTRETATIAGRADVSLWACRFVAPADLRETINEGWRVSAQLDRDTLWHEYRVVVAAESYAMKLTLERVG